MEKTYEQRKEQARETAIAWQYDFENNNYSYYELYKVAAYFAKIAKRYGLVKEFRENGII